MIFEKEAVFEDAVIAVLKQHGWDDADGILLYPTEEDLLRNWAQILLDNNTQIDRLNGIPLTEGEMSQILEQIEALKTPLALNGFINGKTVSIKRDNPEDSLHFGKEISLKIYDRQEIAAGQSRYQIARQPVYKARSKILPDRRGDLCLLINGMPVIHMELKRSGVPVSQAVGQIETYAKEGVFSGLFALVQVFVAMNPDEALYFANPGTGAFNQDFFFHWADYNNEPINNYKRFTSELLSIPMAHQLIGFYTVADSSDGCLKVMRSYQYYAAAAISDKVRKCKWKEPLPSGTRGRLGGFVWHTTGSGKTMTSFKAAHLVADSKDADKVIFLQDRIELGTQTLREYRAFADSDNDVQATENSAILKAKLASGDPKDTLIVSSIQKMSRIKAEAGVTQEELDTLSAKRLVFILDECHRSTFGDMLNDIRRSFPNALYFGFTGTPIQDENQKKQSTTSMIFGDELHRYSIADGIRDKNVLGFDTYKVCTYKDKEVRQAVALEKAKAKDVNEAQSDPEKSEIFYYYMDTSNIAMGAKKENGARVKGIEDFLSSSQYSPRTDHPKKVVEDIRESFPILSHANKFHAIFATSSIYEATHYYELFKKEAPELKISALFDPSVDNNPGSYVKEEALAEIISDYNTAYGQEFTIPTWSKMKKDIAARLAHKKPYVHIASKPEQCIDILIVVDQMLTGFDSKWVNTLYLDKVLHYEGIIQAFSRTNRLFGNEKPFGTIRYYRFPHTMENNIKDAVKLYSGDKPLALFVQKLPAQIEGMNTCFKNIKAVFENNDRADFKSLPESVEACRKFAKDFIALNAYLEAAQIQGFRWDTQEYEFFNDDGSRLVVTCEFSESEYLILAQRYKELFGGGSTPPPPDAPYELAGYLTEIQTGKIDTDYMNANFEKWLKSLGGEDERAASEELHRSFAFLSQEDQRFAELFLHDVERGDVEVDASMTLRDYITLYAHRAKDEQLLRVVSAFGLDAALLKEMIRLDLNENTINEYGRFDHLKASVDKERAKSFFKKQTGRDISLFKVNLEVNKLLRRFILEGGFDIDG